MTKSRSLTFKEHIAAPVEHVYRAFASAQGLQEWFADLVEAEPRQGGRFYAWWNAGFYASGLFQQVEENKSVQFTWQAINEPGETTVDVALLPVDGGTEVTIDHGGLGEGEGWDAVEQNFKREWPSGLSNLKSVLETGIDKRIYDRPMLGFLIGGLVDENLKNRLDLPIDYGMHVSGLVSGMGAERSGLQADDVLAEVDGVEVRTFQTLGPVLAKFKGGDEIQAVIYRGQERVELDIELSKRPIPDFPPPPRELAELGRAVYKDVLKQLKKAVKGTSDKAAGRRPGPGEWNVRETIAHLLVSERWDHAAYDLHADGSKLPAYPESNRILEAIAKSYSLKQLVKELKRSIEVKLNMIASLPEEYAGNKAAYFRMLSDIEDYTRTHWNEHISQIKDTLEATSAVPEEVRE